MVKHFVEGKSKAVCNICPNIRHLIFGYVTVLKWTVHEEKRLNPLLGNFNFQSLIFLNKIYDMERIKMTLLRRHTSLAQVVNKEL